MPSKTEFVFSHVRQVDAIPPSGLRVVLDASEDERKGIARLLRIVGVDQLHADLMALREGSRIRVTGSVTAKARQACVVSLEAVPEEINDTVEVVFAPQDESEAAMRKAGLPEEAEIDKMELSDIDFAAINLEMLTDPDALPEPIIDGQIDFGLIAYETLAIGLEPYPRKAGVEFEPPAEPEGFGSPFAALKALKNKG